MATVKRYREVNGKLVPVNTKTGKTAAEMNATTTKTQATTTTPTGSNRATNTSASTMGPLLGGSAYPTGRALNDSEVLGLERSGYREGDTVPGYGTLLPDGTFRSSQTNTDTGDSTTSGSTSSNSIMDSLNPYLDQSNNDSSALDELRALQRRKESAAKAVINSQYRQLQDEERQRGISDVASRTGQLARVGGGGPDTRFSSAAMGFIDAARNASVKRMNDLSTKKAEALANLDMKSAEQLSELISNEQNRQDQLEQQRFSRIISVLGVQFNMNQENRESTKFDFDMLEKLKALPEGEKYEINGKTYTGLGGGGDIKMYQQDVMTAGGRRSVVFGINGQTGEKVFSTDLGGSPVGTGSNDGYDRYTSGNIPPDVMASLAEDVQKVANGEFGIGELYTTYDDVSPSLINSLVNPLLKYGE